ncbi:MAG TPA: TonB-dependent receptor [Pyrinomonadaceae bacterium]|jgi:hypothetical protein
MYIKKGILLLALAICLQASAAFAQSTTGRIVGTVSDPGGAIVPGATIVVTDNQTKQEKTVTATNDGTFVVPQLVFGTYTVRITAPGYKTFMAADVKIDVGREYPLNAQLEVGQISEEVTVTAGAEQINASNAELSTTITREQIVDLPLNGRNPLSLLDLQAGANPTTDSINGQRSTSTNITRDGLNIQDNYIRTGTVVRDSPTVDDTGEFTLTTQNAGAEQGGGSSQVQLVTPRGGTDYHGNLFIFNRNSEFTANSFFNNEKNIAKPFLNRNQIGGSLSGPLPFPNFGEGGPLFVKNRSFFFFNYEKFLLRQQVTNTATTLLAPARNGDFTYLDTSTNTLRTVNVLTGSGFIFNSTQPGRTNNNNIFSAAGGSLGVDPVIQSRILDRLPTTANGITTGVNYLQTTSFLLRTPTNRDTWSTRVDFDLNDRNSINGVYRRSNSLTGRSGSNYPSGFSSDPYVFSGGPSNFLALSYRSTIGNNFSNEVRGGFNYAEVLFIESNVPQDFLIGGLPVTNPEGSFRDQGRNTLYRNFQDNAVYTTGNHSIRFGASAEFFKFQPFDANGTTPTYTISSTTNPNTPALQQSLFPGTISTTELARANALRYFLGGIIGSGSVTANLNDPNVGYTFGQSIQLLNYELYAPYIQDQWRIRPNLTLNVGLRYELYTPVNAPKALYLEPVLSKPGDLYASLNDPNGYLDYVGCNAGECGSGNFFKMDKDNFAPSFSVAYTPRFEKGLLGRLVGNDTVIRGGFRISYVNDEYLKAASTLTEANAGLGALSTNVLELRSALTPRNGFAPIPTITQLPTFTPPPRSFALNNAARNRTLYAVDPDYQVGRVYEYNVGIQKNIGFDTVLEIRYVGNRNNQVARTINYNEIELERNGFLADFLRAQNNCRLQGAIINPTAPNPLFACTDARYNPSIPGSQPLTVLTQLAPAETLFSFNPNGSVNAIGQSNVAFIQQGRIGAIANNSILRGNQGTVPFQASTNGFQTQVLTNQGQLNYNALQMEVRRRFRQGLSFQVNYTFQKTLGDVFGDDGSADQNRIALLQDNENPKLNYGRTDFDRTHTLNANAVYELPFGRGKRFLNQGGWVDKVFGGFQISSIVNLSSGAPLSVIDPRATASVLAGQYGGQTAISTLTGDQIKDLTGRFETPNGIYFFNPSILYATANPLPGTGLPVLQGIDLYQPLPAGYTLGSVRAASPLGTAPFPGQVFFFNNAGQTGNLPRNFINGLPYLNWDLGLSKNLRFTETTRLQLRMEAFNVLNHQVPYYGSNTDINSNSFGRITQSYNTPRILQFGARFDF